MSTLHLSNRQQEIGNLIAQGKTSKEVAGELKISENYVDHVCLFLRAKFACQNRAQLVAFLVKNNLITETVG